MGLHLYYWYPDHPFYVIFPFQLLQWQHLLRNPPQYLSLLTDVGGQSLISIASQKPMEAFCYMFEGGNGKPLQGVGAPWKLAGPGYVT